MILSRPFSIILIFLLLLGGIHSGYHHHKNNCMYGPCNAKDKSAHAKACEKHDHCDKHHKDPKCSICQFIAVISTKGEVAIFVVFSEIAFLHLFSETSKPFSLLNSLQQVRAPPVV